jgi:regulator of sigma E protease
VQVDDVLLQINAQSIHTFDEASEYIRSHLGEPIEFVVERAGEPLTFRVTPRTEWPEGQGPTGIQLGHPSVPMRYGLPTALLRSAQEIYKQIDLLIHLPSLIIEGQISLEAARPSGPVAIYGLTRWVVSKAIERQNLIGLIQFIGLISVALGTTNLLPIPALDGGRILFVLIEAVRGRRMAPEREAMVHLVGMLLLLAMMIFITYQDIVNPIVPR